MVPQFGVSGGEHEQSGEDGNNFGTVSGESSDEGGYDTRLKREELDLIFEDSNDEDAVAGDGDDC